MVNNHISRKRKQRKKIKKIILSITVFFAVAVVIFFFCLQGQSKNSKEEIAKSAYLKSLKYEGIDNDLVILQDFLSINPYSRPGKSLKTVNNIVVHYVGNPGVSAANNRSYFENLKDTHEAYASSHYIVGLGGEVIQCIPLNEISYCSNNRNKDTIAIEVCHPDEMGKFTDKSYNNLVKLCAWLCKNYKLSSKDLIRHYDVTGKLCPIYYVENPEEWEKFKLDVENKILQN